MDANMAGSIVAIIIIAAALFFAITRRTSSEPDLDELFPPEQDEKEDGDFDLMFTDHSREGIAAELRELGKTSPIVAGPAVIFKQSRLLDHAITHGYIGAERPLALFRRMTEQFPEPEDAAWVAQNGWLADEIEGTTGVATTTDRGGIATRLREIAVALRPLSDMQENAVGAPLVDEGVDLEVAAVDAGFITEAEADALFAASAALAPCDEVASNHSYVNTLYRLADRIEHGPAVTENDVREALAAEGAGV